MQRYRLGFCNAWSRVRDAGLPDGFREFWRSYADAGVTLLRHGTFIGVARCAYYIPARRATQIGSDFWEL